MKTSMMTLVAGLTRGWVHLYTSGLLAEVKDARRAEIDSDIWEQEQDANADGRWSGEGALQLFGRLLLGAPADLSWRFEQVLAIKHPEKRGKHVVDRKVSMSTLVHMGFSGVIVVLGLIALSQGVGAGLGLVDTEQGTIWWEVTLSLSAGVALLAGIRVMERSPLLSGGLVAFGVIVIGLATLWTVIIPIVMALVVVGTFVRALRLARERNSLLR